MGHRSPHRAIAEVPWYGTTGDVPIPVYGAVWAFKRVLPFGHKKGARLGALISAVSRCNVDIAVAVASRQARCTPETHKRSKDRRGRHHTTISGWPL